MDLSQVYKSALKVVLIIGLIPIIIGIAVALFWSGLALDFGGQSDTMYSLLHPAIFVVGILWAMYAVKRFFRTRNYNKLKDQARREINQQYGLGDSVEENAIQLLWQKGPQTSEQLASSLGLTHDEVLSLIRTLLATGKVIQQVTGESTTLSLSTLPAHDTRL